MTDVTNQVDGTTNQEQNNPDASAASQIPNSNSTSSLNNVGAANGSASVLPGTYLSDSQMNSITNTNIQNASDPSLSASETVNPVNQQAQSGELMTYNPISTSADQVNDQNIAPSTVSSTAEASNPATNIQPATYQANTVDPAQLAQTTQAVTSSLPADALVSTQLQKLLTPDASGNLPPWVQPAITAANQLLAGRGISNTTMAGQAITSAIMTAAIPVAEANASAVQSAWSQNLTAENAAAMQNGQNMANAILSNQGAENAAANFNATSENQTNQYIASMAAQINQFNATQTNAMSQFNASQSQTANIDTAQLDAQIDQFNANMNNQQTQFNAQNSLIVQQSNSEYLRAVNTANTAAANQANQENAQNALGVSNAAMANLQTQFNDEATMLYNSNMTQEQQNYAMTYLAQQYGDQAQLVQQTINDEELANLDQQIGNTVGSFIAPALNGLGSLLKGATSSDDPSSSSNPSTNSNGNTGTNDADTNNQNTQDSNDQNFLGSGDVGDDGSGIDF